MQEWSSGQKYKLKYLTISVEIWQFSVLWVIASHNFTKNSAFDWNKNIENVLKSNEQPRKLQKFSIKFFLNKIWKLEFEKVCKNMRDTI